MLFIISIHWIFAWSIVDCQELFIIFFFYYPIILNVYVSFIHFICVFIVIQTKIDKFSECHIYIINLMKKKENSRTKQKPFNALITHHKKKSWFSLSHGFETLPLILNHFSLNHCIFYRFYDSLISCFMFQKWWKYSKYYSSIVIEA